MRFTASPTVLIFSASSSGMSMLNSVSNAMTSSTWSRESAPRSSVIEASGVTSSSSTPSCSTMIFFTLSKVDMLLLRYAPRASPEDPFVLLSSSIPMREWLHVESTVHSKHLAGHVPGGIRTEERHHAGHVLGLAEATKRNCSKVRLFRGIGKVGRHRRLDEPRSDGVDSYLP